MMVELVKKKLNSGMGKDVAWTFALQIIIMLCSFAINKILSNRLSIDDFGQYNVIKRSVQVLSFVMLAGVGIALPRYIPLYKGGESRQSIIPLLCASLLYMSGVALVVSVGCAIFSGQVGRLIIGQMGDSVLLAVALAYAFTLALAQFVYAYYRGIGNFKWYNGTQLVVQLAIILPLVLLPVLTTSYVFVSWLIVTALLVAFYLGRELWRKHFPLTAFAKGMPMLGSCLRAIVKYSSWRLLADFFLFSLSAFPLVYISSHQGLQPTAYYSVGVTFVTMVTPVFSFMGIILLPYVSQAIARNELKDANRFVNRLAMLYISASLLITAVMYVFIGFLTSLFFAESYVVTSNLSRIMILSILPQALYLLYRNPIDAVAVFPYNTLILGVCLLLMVVAFCNLETIEEFAWAYLGVSLLQGGLSWLTWKLLQNKKI
ncbi:MAG: oligosaccharide flippase family protein [Prevotella sp.]|nr:oligosaccharide flippase family protein [Prevotella sp.]